MLTEIISNSTCEGFDQVRLYECRVTGRGIIVWSGSAFNCRSTNNELHLLLSSSDIEETSCNSGAIVGQIIRAENNTYISWLTISVSAEMIGTNVSCLHDSGVTHGQKLVGSSILTITTGS